MNEVKQDAAQSKKRTLIIDIENVFLAELNIRNGDDLEIVEKLQNQENQLVIIQKYNKNQSLINRNLN